MRYDYYCIECNARWEETQFMNDRDLPLSLPCPHCAKLECVKRGVVSLAVSYQGGKTVLQRAGSGWNDVLVKIKKASGRKNSLETR
jgi:predicted nucleic acid-binding Zn ribbon protein